MATNPHIYVSSVHGTNTGATDTSFASAQTGAMTSITASSVYDNLESAIDGASPSSGDIIYIADDHSASYTSGTITINSGFRNAAGMIIASVDAANVDQYKPGAAEITTSNGIVLQGVGIIAGVSFQNDDNVIVGSTNCIWRLQDLTLTTGVGGNDAPVTLNQDGAVMTLINVDIVFSGISNEIFLSNGSMFTMIGGSIGGSAAVNVFGDMASNGGCTVKLKGTDLSTQSGTLVLLGTATATDACNFLFDSCKLHASVTMNNTLTHSGELVESFNSDDSTSDDYWRFYVATGCGSVQNNDAAYVTATETWYEGSVKSSMEVTTTAICSKASPFAFELPAQYVDLSQEASDVLTLELTTDLTLTDTDIAAFLVYPDGTTAVQPNWVTSGKTVGTGNYGIDPLAAGTTLTTGALGAGDWTGEPTSPNFYKMVLDTSGDAGQATAVSIRIEVYKGGASPITAGKLFIHPLLTLS